MAAETVLITGARAPVALDIARSFAAAGWRVHMADSVPARIARWSRVPERVHRLPPPRQAPARFATAMRLLADRIAPALILPTCEEIFHLAPLGLPGLFAPDPAMLHRLHAKHRFAALCAERGLAVPETHLVDRPGDLERFAAASCDWVFKPAYSRFGVSALVGPDAAALRAWVVPTPVAPWVVQRRLAGEEQSFYAVCRDGRLVAFAAYRSSWRLKGGAGYAFAALPDGQAAALRAMAETLAATIGTGQFACDAIRSGDGQGRVALIECNPRATSGAHLLGRGPALARAILGQGEAAPVRGLRAHVGPALYCYGLGAVLKGRPLRDWWTEQRRGRDVIGAPGDRRPVAGALADSAGFGLKALLARRSLAGQMTADIEWNGPDAEGKEAGA